MTNGGSYSGFGGGGDGNGLRNRRINFMLVKAVVSPKAMLCCLVDLNDKSKIMMGFLFGVLRILVIKVKAFSHAFMLSHPMQHCNTPYKHDENSLRYTLGFNTPRA